MIKNKIESTKSLNGAKGGSSNHMFGKSGVQPSKEGVSAPPNKPSFDKNRPRGGGKDTVKQAGSRPSQAGKVTPAALKGGGGNKFGVKGGKGHMAGKSGASSAKPA